MFGQNDQTDNNQIAQQNDGQLSGGLSTPPPPTSQLITPDNSTAASDSNDPVGTSPTAPEPSAIADTSSSDASQSSQVSEPAGDLEEIKTQALEKLSPIVDQLDQTAEEKFRTTMMMIQATDNQSLIKTAYQAAQDIEDKSERAKALLAVINEIEYFRQNDKNKE